MNIAPILHNKIDLLSPHLVEGKTRIISHIADIFIEIISIMANNNTLNVKETLVQTISINGVDYVSITDIARFKNPLEPKDVVKNWMRTRNTIEYLGLWEKLHNPDFKGVEFDPLMQEVHISEHRHPPLRRLSPTAEMWFRHSKKPKIDAFWLKTA